MSIAHRYWSPYLCNNTILERVKLSLVESISAVWTLVCLVDLLLCLCELDFCNECWNFVGMSVSFIIKNIKIGVNK